jgi:hypothetical protein
VETRAWHFSNRFGSWEIIEYVRATKSERLAALSKSEATRAMRAAIDGDQGPQLFAELRAGALKHLLPHALDSKHVREEFLNLVARGRVLVIAQRQNNGAEADVVVVAALGTDDAAKDPDCVPATELVARCLHGQGAVVQWVSAANDIAPYLRGFRRIRRLVFMTHGSAGCIRVWDNDRSLSRYAEQIEGAQLRCAEVVFEGCHVGEGGNQVVAFMQAVRAETATGYTGYHAWGMVTVPTIRGEDPGEIEGQRFFKRTRRFLVEGQPGAADLVRHPGRHQLACEFFCRDRPSEDNILVNGTDAQVGRLFDRHQLGRPHECRVADAARLTGQLEARPSGELAILTFTR